MNPNMFDDKPKVKKLKPNYGDFKKVMKICNDKNQTFEHCKSLSKSEFVKKYKDACMSDLNASFSFSQDDWEEFNNLSNLYISNEAIKLYDSLNTI